MTSAQKGGLVRSSMQKYLKCVDKKFALTEGGGNIAEISWTSYMDPPQEHNSFPGGKAKCSPRSRRTLKEVAARRGVYGGGGVAKGRLMGQPGAGGNYRGGKS